MSSTQPMIAVAILNLLVCPQNLAEFHILRWSAKVGWIKLNWVGEHKLSTESSSLNNMNDAWWHYWKNILKKREWLGWRNKGALTVISGENLATSEGDEFLDEGSTKAEGRNLGRRDLETHPSIQSRWTCYPEKCNGNIKVWSCFSINTDSFTESPKYPALLVQSSSTHQRRY